MPAHINDLEWQQAVGLARQSCARIFKDGGSPAAAMHAFGLRVDADAAGWDKAVMQIAEVLCTHSTRQAA